MTTYYTCEGQRRIRENMDGVWDVKVAAERFGRHIARTHYGPRAKVLSLRLHTVEDETRFTYHAFAIPGAKNSKKGIGRGIKFTVVIDRAEERDAAKTLKAVQREITKQLALALKEEREARDGEEENPDDTEWPTLAACAYERVQAIKAIQKAAGV